MWARHDATSRRLKHWSTVAFTAPPAPGEADAELPDGTVLPGPVERLRLTADFANLELDPALVSPAPELAEEFRMGLGSIFKGTALEKRQRWMDVREQYAPTGDVLILLRGQLGPDAKGHLTELFTRIRAKIGTGATEVLTATEYQALRTLAVAKGLGALVPAYP